MNCHEAAQWVRNECILQGHNYELAPTADGGVEVNVNGRFVFGYNGENAQIAREDVERAYGAAVMARRMERLDDGNVVYHPDPEGRRDGTEVEVVNNGDLIEGGLPPKLVGPGIIDGDLQEIAFAGDEGDLWLDPFKGHTHKQSFWKREATLGDAGWIQGWPTAISIGAVNSSSFGYNYPAGDVGRLVTQAKQCSAKRHVIAADAEFCSACCWNCQKDEGTPFCASCRKERLVEAESELREWAADHFGSIE